MFDDAVHNASLFHKLIANAIITNLLFYCDLALSREDCVVAQKFLNQILKKSLIIKETTLIAIIIKGFSFSSFREFQDPPISDGLVEAGFNKRSKFIWRAV
jgi:hypothetical protein